MPHLLTGLHAYSNAVVYILRKTGHYLHCYLKDFVGVAATREVAKEAYSDLIATTAALGLTLSP